MKKKTYKKALYAAQVELVKLQKHVIAEGLQVLLIFEGRDAAGKDGTIKRIVEHMSPRETRVFAPAKPSDREVHGWYFQRYAAQLPVAGEIVLFNRSWYSRAGVERVMGFCTHAECESFLQAVPTFEQILVQSGIAIFKYYLDITRAEQKQRLKERRKDPLTQWKISPIDEVAQKHWKDYSKARDEMLARSHHLMAPWTVVRADDKEEARINVIGDLLSRFDYKGKDNRIAAPDRGIVFGYEPDLARKGSLAS